MGIYSDGAQVYAQNHGGAARQSDGAQGLAAASANIGGQAHNIGASHITEAVSIGDNAPVFVAAADSAAKPAHFTANQGQSRKQGQTGNEQININKQADAAQGAGTVQPAGEAHAKPSFPPFDSSFFASNILWLAITFGVFYLFMARIALPRIGGIIETRRDRVAADLDQAARMKTEADAAVQSYQKSLHEARDRAKSIAGAATEEARAKAGDERKTIEAELEKKLAESDGRIVDFRNKALAEVDNIARDIAGDIVQKISGREADGNMLAQAVAAEPGTRSAAL